MIIARRQAVTFLPYLLAILMLTSTTAYAGCTTRFSVAWLEWKPYQMLERGQVTGMDIELLDAIMTDAGCHYTLRKIPWERTMRFVRSGDIDLAIGASKTPERAAWASFSEPYREEIVALFVRDNILRRWDELQELEDLKTLQPRIAVVRGAYYGARWEELKPQLSVRELSRYDQLFNLLHLNRVDLILNDLYNGYMLTNKLGYRFAIRPLNLVASREDIHLMFSQKTVPETDIAHLNRSIRKLRASGRLDSIINSYLYSQTGTQRGLQ